MVDDVLEFHGVYAGLLALAAVFLFLLSREAAAQIVFLASFATGFSGSGRVCASAQQLTCCLLGFGIASVARPSATSPVAVSAAAATVAAAIGATGPT